MAEPVALEAKIQSGPAVYLAVVSLLERLVLEAAVAVEVALPEDQTAAVAMAEATAAAVAPAAPPE